MANSATLGRPAQPAEGGTERRLARTAYLELFNLFEKIFFRVSQMTLVVKSLLANTRDVKARPGLTPGSQDAPEKEVATHPSILAWEVPWTEEP